MLKEKSKKSGKDSVKFRMWLQKKKRNAVLGTVRSIIRNMINGVTNGYKFKMVLAYAHFPLVVNIVDNGRVTNLFYVRLLKSRTSWVSKWTKESTPLKESSSPKKNNKRTTLLFKVSTSNTFLKFALESNKPQSSKTKISVLSWTVSTFKMPDSNTTTDTFDVI